MIVIVELQQSFLAVILSDVYMEYDLLFDLKGKPLLTNKVTKFPDLLPSFFIFAKTLPSAPPVLPIVLRR